MKMKREIKVKILIKDNVSIRNISEKIAEALDIGIEDYNNKKGTLIVEEWRNL